MTEEKEHRIAYILAIVLLVVGVLSYAAFSAKEPDVPFRISYFESKGGKTIFTHQAHAYDYRLSCITCHHSHPEGEEDEVDFSTPGKEWSCSACHNIPEGGTLPISCLDCHDEGEILVEDMKRLPDVLHQQCIGCHKDEGIDVVECASCHMN